MTVRNGQVLPPPFPGQIPETQFYALTRWLSALCSDQICPSNEARCCQSRPSRRRLWFIEVAVRETRKPPYPTDSLQPWTTSGGVLLTPIATPQLRRRWTSSPQMYVLLLSNLLIMFSDFVDQYKHY